MQTGVLIAIALGGALGALARYATNEAVRGLCEGFPLATFAINVVGCFAFGLCYAMHAGSWPAPLTAAVFVGFLGAFTTFSTFAFETLDLLQQGKTIAALANALLQNGLGVLGVFLGLAAGRLLGT